DHVYFVYSGTAEVVKHQRELNQLNRLAILRPGSQFSEFSVLNRAGKAASVFALEECELFRMSGEVFLELLKQFPHIAKKLVIHLARMSHHVQTAKFRMEYVQSEAIDINNQILTIMPPKSWRRHEALPLRLANRALFVAVKDPQNQTFYEFIHNNNPLLQIYISLINDADFDALEKGLTEAYANTNKESSRPPCGVKTQPLEGDIATWLPQISLFKEMPTDWIPQLSECLSYETFTPGQSIYKKNVASDKLYILLSGQVEIAKPLSFENAAIYVSTLSPGDYFAEVSLLTQNPHILSARAISDVKVAVLSKDYLENFLKAPFFTLPLARDLAIQFQSISNATSFHFFDPIDGLQVKELTGIIPKSIIAQYEILPLRLKEDELTVGITNPESDIIYSIISRYIHNYRVNLEIIKPADFKKWQKEIESASGEESSDSRQNLQNLATGNAVNLLDHILREGFEGRASDIHFEPSSECFIVRYRVDGVLREGADKYTKEVGAEIINRIKVLSSLDMTNKFTPQDGQMQMELSRDSVFARVSTLPAKHGENVVMRLIRKKNTVPPLSVLVPDQRVINILRNVVNTKQGVFLVTGPTGSGKSTTLYSLIQELNQVEVSIISLEDPVEMEIDGITQVEINEKQGLTFEIALRSTLRQDPNVIMIGEIRDEESAKIAFHAASTGQLVISTLHTNNSLNVIPRLLDFGVSQRILASTLIGASAQRLVRLICRKCRDVRDITDYESEILKAELKTDNLPSEMPYGKGCYHCNGTGYYGRISLIEVWEKTLGIERVLMQSTDIADLTAELQKQEFETLTQFALKMVINGLTTVEEVHRRLGFAKIIEKENKIDKAA
ncbi:MAG: hypothetical protein A2Z20_00380, partial [Bdellovibrionales bacterium RBG_16_40_8]